MAFVYTQELCKLLKTSEAALSRLHLNGHLLRFQKGAYRSEDIDAFLEGCAYDFGDALPTWSGIKSGRLLLVSSEEAKTFTGLTVRELRIACARLQVPRIKFPDGTFRYSKLDLQNAFISLTPSMSAQAVMFATGYGDTRGLRQVPELEIVYSTRGTVSERLFFSRRSVERYLQAHLPPWISVADWLSDCEVLDEPLKTTAEAAAVLGLKPHQLSRQLERLRAHFVLRRGAGGALVPMISPIWLLAYMGMREQLKAEDVARLFDVHPDNVRRWRQEGKIRCVIDGHAHDQTPYLGFACWVAYLRATCGSGLQDTMWLFAAYRLGHAAPPPLLRIVDVVNMTGSIPRTVRVYARSGRLPYILTPNGYYRFIQAWVEQAQFAGLKRQNN